MSSETALPEAALRSPVNGVVGAVPSTKPHRPRDHWVSLVQVICCVLVIGAHSGVPGMLTVWVVVEFFFVIAAMHMVSALERRPALGDYAAKRVMRMMPDYAIVWLAVAAVMLVRPTHNGHVFLVSGALFLNNWQVPAAPRPLSDLMWAPLWFIGSLIQLQILAYLVWPWFRRLNAATGIIVCLLAGLVSRALYIAAATHQLLPGTIDQSIGFGLYCSPLSHIEAMGLGLLIGNRKIAFAGWRWTLVPIGVFLFGLGFCAAMHLPKSTLGFPITLSEYGQYLWGYPLVALSAAVLVAPAGVVSRAMNRRITSPELIRPITTAAGLSFSIYVLHASVVCALLLLLPEHLGVWPRALLCWAIAAVATTLLSLFIKRCQTTWEERRAAAEPVSAAA